MVLRRTLEQVVLTSSHPRLGKIQDIGYKAQG